jgi:hypothetical protein
MQTLTLTVFMPDGSTKIFEDIQGIEQPSDNQVTFLCKGSGEGLRSVTINLNLTLGYEIDGIVPKPYIEEEEE